MTCMVVHLQLSDRVLQAVNQLYFDTAAAVPPALVFALFLVAQQTCLLTGRLWVF